MPTMFCVSTYINTFYVSCISLSNLFRNHSSMRVKYWQQKFLSHFMLNLTLFPTLKLVVRIQSLLVSDMLLQYIKLVCN